MRRSILHALTVTTFAGVVAVPVATVTLAEPLRVAAADDSPVVPAVTLAPELALDRAQLADSFTTRRAATAQAELRAEAAARKVAAEKAAARKAAQKAAQKAAAEKAAAEKAAADKAAAEKAAAAAAARKAAAERAAARAEAERQAAAERRAVAQRAKERRSSAARASRSASDRTPLAASGSPRSLARTLLASYGEASQFGCLDSLWSKERGWSTSASNSSSGAYGIPQALPGSKMASAGSDWRTNPATQVRWGIGYIESTYGSPCAAWSHSQANGWY